MYLVTITKKKLTIFARLFVYAPKLHTDAPTSEINCHEASVWYQYDALNIANTLTHKTYLVMYLVTITKKKQICRFCPFTSLRTQVAPICPDFCNKWS